MAATGLNAVCFYCMRPIQPGQGAQTSGMQPPESAVARQLTQYDERGWRATFYTSGVEHSPTSATGSAWERAPWHAVQGAAWEALRRAEGNEA